VREFGRLKHSRTQRNGPDGESRPFGRGRLWRAMRPRLCDVPGRSPLTEVSASGRASPTPNGGSVRMSAARAHAHVDARDDHALTGLVAREEAEQTPHVHGERIGARQLIPRASEVCGPYDLAPPVQAHGSPDRGRQAVRLGLP